MPDTNLGYDRLPLDPPVQDQPEWDDHSAPDDPNFPWGKPPPAPPSPTEVAQALPFGQGDEAELNKLRHGLTKVTTDFRYGTIDKATADDITGQYLQALGPLEQRKKATEAAAEANFTQKALGQSAMQQAVVAANQQHAAQSFLNGVASVNDPATGKVRMFAQTEPAKFEPVDFGESDRPVDQGAGDATPGEADRPIQPDRVNVVPGADGEPSRLEIWNGPHKQVMTFDPQTGKTLSYEPDSYGQPGQNQQKAEGAYISDHERTLNRNKAEQDFARVPESPRKRLAVAQAQQHYDTITKQENRDKAQNTALDQRQQTREQAAKERDKAKQDADLTAKQLSDLHTKRYKELSDELNRVRKQNTAAAKENATKAEGDPKTPMEPIPDWAKNEDTMDEEAWRRAERAHKKAYPHRQEGETPAEAQPAAPAKAAESPAAPVAKTAEEAKRNLERIAADEARRAKARPPSPAEQALNPPGYDPRQQVFLPGF